MHACTCPHGIIRSSTTVARPQPALERSLSHISPDLGYSKVVKGVYIGTALHGPQDAHHLAAALNIRTVLCLQTSAELEALDISIGRVAQEASFAGITHVHVPIDAGCVSGFCVDCQTPPTRLHAGCR